MKSQPHLFLLLHTQDEEELLFFSSHQCTHLANLHPSQRSRNPSRHRCHMYDFASSCGKIFSFQQWCSRKYRILQSCNTIPKPVKVKHMVINCHQRDTMQSPCSMNLGHHVSSVHDAYASFTNQFWTLAREQLVCKCISASY